MKRLAILMFFGGLLSLPSGAQSEEKASPLMTALSSTTISGYISSSVWWAPGAGNVRISPGDPFSGYRHTPSGWRAHVCRWSHRIGIPERNRFRDRGVYGRCRHGVVYLPARQLRVPPGRFPVPPPRPPPPFPPLPRPTPGTPGTTIPSRVIRTPPPAQIVLMEANRMRSGTSGGRLPPPPMPPTPLGPITPTPPPFLDSVAELRQSLNEDQVRRALTPLSHDCAYDPARVESAGSIRLHLGDERARKYERRTELDNRVRDRRAR